MKNLYKSLDHKRALLGLSIDRGGGRKMSCEQGRNQRWIRPYLDTHWYKALAEGKTIGGLERMAGLEEMLHIRD